MASIIQLRSDTDLWCIKDIPPYRTEKDTEKLRARCEPIFRIKGNRHVVMITGRGEIISGLTTIDLLLRYYKAQRLITMIRFTTEDVKLLTHVSA